MILNSQTARNALLQTAIMMAEHIGPHLRLAPVRTLLKDVSDAAALVAGLRPCVRTVLEDVAHLHRCQGVNRLSPSFGSSVRFIVPHATADTQQFIHTVTAKALTLPLGDM